MLPKRKPRVRRRSLQITIYPKTGRSNGKATSRKKKSRLQTGFLNRYDFAYAGRDVVDQVGKAAPKMITQATGEINKIAQDSIDQIVRSGGAETERAAPKLSKERLKKYTKYLLDFLVI